MSKSLQSAVVSAMTGTQKRPVLLYELGLSTPIKFAGYKTNIVFPTGGTTYSAKAATISSVSHGIEGQIGRISVKFDNTARDMAAYANNEAFRGKSLVIKRIYLDAISNALNYVEVFNGYMESPAEIGRNWLMVSATSGKPLYKKSLSFPYQRLCNAKFGDSRCSVDINTSDYYEQRSDITPVFGSYTEFYIVDPVTEFELDDELNKGNINITIDGETYSRKVKKYYHDTYESQAVRIFQLDVGLPVELDSSLSYEVWKGCDYTWDTCSSTNAWGPIADNSANFRGFIHITAKQDAL